MQECFGKNLQISDFNLTEIQRIHLRWEGNISEKIKVPQYDLRQKAKAKVQADKAHFGVIDD
jgi:hypothetical protein